MASDGKKDSGRWGNIRWDNIWRVVPWAVAAPLLLLPLVAMQFTGAVAWDVADFLVAGAMLFAACGVWEVVTRMTDNTAYRAAAGIAIAAALILIWINLAVGIIGVRIIWPI